MSNKPEKVCRLCLRTTNDDFEVIEDITREMLGSLPLKIDLSISKNPLICNNCSENLQESFDFKHNINGATHDLNELTLGDNTDYVFCQFCVQYIKKDKCRALDKLKQDSSLAQYFPEMGLDVSLVCIPCLVSLENCIRFFTNCSNIEEKIKTFYKVQDLNNRQVELSDLVQLVSKDMSESKEVLQGTDEIIKNERFTQANDQEKSAILQENLIKVENHEVLIKNERDNTKKTITERALDFKIIYYCDNCTYEVKQEIGLQCHKLTHKCNSIATDSHITKYICDECPYESKLKSHMKRHLLTHKTPLIDTHTDLSEGTIYICEECDFTTNKRPHLSFHKLSHKHSLKVPMYKCESCDYQTRRLRYIKKHVRTHTRMEKCNVCGLKISLFDLAAHMLTHGYEFKCKHCTFTTKEKDRLTSHMSTHNSTQGRMSQKNPTVAQLHRCHLCSREFKNKSNFQRHRLVHKNASELIMYKCQWCSYQAKRRYQLRAHMLIHKDPSEIKWYKCGVCDYKNKIAYALKRHMAKHAKHLPIA